jgi:hypothetical protein
MGGRSGKTHPSLPALPQATMSHEVLPGLRKSEGRSPKPKGGQGRRGAVSLGEVRGGIRPQELTPPLPGRFGTGS